MSTAPEWLDTGSNAWQLTASTFVGLQSIPGLMILYAGLVKSKWAVNSAFMAFYAFAAVMICWVLWAYKVAFGKHLLPFAGIPGPTLSMEYQMTQAILPTTGITAAFPMSTLVFFQFVFAAITLIITAGSFLGRMNLLAWIVFVPLWLTFSYCALPTLSGLVDSWLSSVPSISLAATLSTCPPVLQALWVHGGLVLAWMKIATTTAQTISAPS